MGRDEFPLLCHRLSVDTLFRAPVLPYMIHPWASRQHIGSTKRQYIIAFGRLLGWANIKLGLLISLLILYREWWPTFTLFLFPLGKARLSPAYPAAPSARHDGVRSSGPTRRSPSAPRAPSRTVRPSWEPGTTHRARERRDSCRLAAAPVRLGLGGAAGQGRDPPDPTAPRGPADVARSPSVSVKPAIIFWVEMGLMG